MEALFDVRGSAALTERQRERLLARAGPMVRAVSQDERSQWRNREVALERLTTAIREGLRAERRRRPTTPPPESRERRLAEKRRRAETKQLRREPEE